MGIFNPRETGNYDVTLIYSCFHDTLTTTGIVIIQVNYVLNTELHSSPFPLYSSHKSFSTQIILCTSHSLHKSFYAQVILYTSHSLHKSFSTQDSVDTYNLLRSYRIFFSLREVKRRLLDKKRS